ncbi:MAG: tyrosine-type recombinase/integrase [Clostridiales bacterium]|nr:tyrosine-type recombinase/integrase [Clostridiales bacterium]
MSAYTDELTRAYTARLRLILRGLPDFCDEFFRGIADDHGVRTRLVYAYDIKLFLEFLSANVPKFARKPLFSYEMADLNSVTVDDVEEFMEYLSYYVKEYEGRRGAEFEISRQNAAVGKYRKLSALRTMYAYFMKKRKSDANPAAVISAPKLKEKPIIQLEPEEVARLLDEVESGEKLTPAQKQYHEYTKYRDLAIITLLLGTGMRVSECVGIDIKHIDFAATGVRVTRKGGGETVLYFGEEVADALMLYLPEREKTAALPGHGEALFLSLQKRRITARAVQNLVKKYAGLISGLKKITPHKLRSTFATSLYRETGDIYLVADILGHADVNTTRKHYARIHEDRRREAVKHVKLRSE